MKENVKVLEKTLLPLLYSISLTYWAMSSFFGEPAIGTLITAAILHILLFVGFALVLENGVLGKLISVMCTALYFATTFFIIASSVGSYGRSYFFWIVVTKPASLEFIYGYWLGTVLLSAFGFSFTVFYFTCVRYRIGVLFMIGIIPFILQSAKTDKELTLPFILFLILFFSLYVERSWRKAGNAASQGKYIGNGWYMGAVGIFVMLVLGLSAITPKPNTIPRLAYIDAVIGQTLQPLAAAALNTTQGRTGLQGLFNPLENRSMSRLDLSSAPVSEIVFFEVEAEEPLYFRLQSRDRYTMNSWVTDNKSLYEGYPVESFYTRRLTLQSITSLLSVMEEEELTEIGLDGLSDLSILSSVPQKKRMATVFTGIRMRNLLNPSGIYGAEVSGTNTDIMLSEAGNCFLEGVMPRDSEKYSLNYISPMLTGSSREFHIMKRMNKNLFYSLMKKVSERYGNNNINDYEYINISNWDDLQYKDYKQVLGEAELEMSMAYSNYTSLPDYIPDRIYDLANDITADKKSDYDKASAIEQFFDMSDFTYTLSPPTLPQGMDVNDFFIFESKKGFCIHFASSMVVLARACGLPARYTEGYVSDEKDNKTGRYLIREKHAHAFPEVYIAGYGWKIFEPTVGLTDNEDDFFVLLMDMIEEIKYLLSGLIDFIISIPVWIKIMFIPFVVFTFLHMIWLYLHIRNGIWRKRLMKESGTNALEEVFSRIAHQFKKINLGIVKSETPLSYAQRIYEESGVEILTLAEAFSKAKYGGMEPSLEDIKDAMGLYSQVVLIVKARKGKLKAWLIK